MKKITLIPGDGIGYEISESLVKIFDAAKVPIEFETENAGSDVYEKTGELIPESLYESVERNKIAIKGPITTPIGKGFRSINVYLRKKYDLYTNFRPSRNLPGIETRYDNIDLAIFRENTEGIYIGEEKYENEEKTSAIAIKRITRKGSKRIIQSAFEYAKNNGISKVTVVHKANILKFTDGMFLDIAREISKEYENIQLEELIIDNMCMQLVTNPERFKVIVTMNLYGDILSDLVAGLVGGLGVAPGANIGDDIAIFEAVHGSAPDIAGQNKANPLALLLSSIEMLKYLKLDNFAKNIENAILKTLTDGCKTADLGGSATTTEFTDKIKSDFINELGVMFTENNYISDDIYNKLNVKRGLRNKNGTGVLVGLTKIGSVLGYSIDKDGKKVPSEGKLYYRGIPIEKLVAQFRKEKTFCFEKTMFLLLFGKVPSNFELKMFISTLKEYQHLPDEFIEDFILRKPGTDIMNQLQRSVLCLYTLDENPDDISLSNLIDQSLNLIAKFPSLLVYCYQACNYKHFNKSLIIHNPVEEYSIAQNILHMLRSDNNFTELEAEVLDLILVIHAEHGGGNNSTFTSHVVSSTRTDTYSSISASIGSLKGPMHGGANSMVTKMVEDIKKNTNPYDEVKLKEYLKKIFQKEVFDKKGRIYGMGHAVYTISDPRAVILKKKAYELAKEKKALEEFELFSSIEKLTREIGKELKGKNFEICANVDLYSGFVYKLLNIPQNIFTPLFALSRIASWNAHRMEQILVDKKLIRPAYKAIDENGNVFL